MNQLVISMIRTYVPLIVGPLIASGLSALGVIDVNVDGVVATIVSVCIGGYWLAVRLISKKIPKAEILLGHVSPPVYPPAPEA